MVGRRQVVKDTECQTEGFEDFILNYFFFFFCISPFLFSSEKRQTSNEMVQWLTPDCIITSALL